MLTVNIILFLGLILAISIFAMRGKVSYSLSLVLLILVSLFASLIIAQRPTNEDFMVQNDTAHYNNFFNCIRENRAGGCENVVIQMPPNELMIGAITRVLTSLGFDNATIFFSIAFLFCIACIAFIRPLGNLMPLAFSLILTTPIFWELTSAAMRASLSISFFLLLVSVLLKKNQSRYKKIGLYCGGALSHSSFFIYTPLFFLYKQFSVRTLFVLFIAGLVLSSILTKLLFGFSDLLWSGSVIANKLMFYVRNSSGIGLMNYIYVIGKMNILVICYLYFASLTIKSIWFLSAFKILLLILIGGSLLGDTNFVYRVINGYEILMIPLLIFTVKVKSQFSGYLLFVYSAYKIYMFDYFYESYIRFFI
ncbi:MAG: hypothetical protein AXW17_02300 [Colwellia sp. Phe_37]|nr:MAG: hypothetical protein AXW17_02300 [Colwellia sp. Phe_37]